MKRKILEELREILFTLIFTFGIAVGIIGVLLIGITKGVIILVIAWILKCILDFILKRMDKDKKEEAE